MESSAYSFEIGAAGVDIFFVISGFIMASLMLGAESAQGVFVKRRLIRIVPLYWTVTLAVLVVGLVEPRFFYDLDITAENALLSLAFLPHDSETGVAPVLWQGWTLEYEMFFYALCALALAAPASLRLALLGAVLVALVGAGFLLRSANPFLAVYTSPLLLEFGAGVALAAAWRRRLFPRPMVGAIALVAGATAYALQHFDVLPTTGGRVIDWGAPALLMVGGALCLEAGGGVWRSRAAAFLGDASYSAYLTHGFAVGLFLWYFADVSLWVRVPACLAGSILLAAASYQLFERPLTNWLKRASPFPTRARSVTASLGK